jgi:hypothetical protein
VLPVGATNVTASRATARRSTRSMRAVLSARIDLSGLSMSVLGRIGVPAGSGNVFVGNGIAYVGAVNTTVRLCHRRRLQPASDDLLARGRFDRHPGQAIVANGSGLAVSVGALSTSAPDPSGACARCP